MSIAFGECVLADEARHGHDHSEGSRLTSSEIGDTPATVL